MTIASPIKVPLNTTTFTAVDIPAGAELIDSAFFTDDGSDLIYATDLAGTDAVTLPRGAMSIPRIKTGQTLLYAKGTVASTNLIVQLGRT